MIASIELVVGHLEVVHAGTRLILQLDLAGASELIPLLGRVVPQRLHPSASVNFLGELHTFVSRACQETPSN